MGLKDILSREGDLTLSDLQEFQRIYDDRFVAKKGFVGFDKVRHTYAHMGKLIGRLADYVHDMEESPEKASGEDIRTKVIPDLLVYCAWLANEFEVKMDESYLGRMVGNLKRLYSKGVSSEEMTQIEHAVNKKIKD